MSHAHEQPQASDAHVEHNHAHEPRHPLDPLTGDEIEASREILVAAGLLGDSMRVPMLLPHEPTKLELAAWVPGEQPDRRVDATLMDVTTGKVLEVIVSITRGANSSGVCNTGLICLVRE